MLRSVIARNASTAAVIALLWGGCVRLNPDYADGADEAETLPSTGDTGRLTSPGGSASGTTRTSGGATSMGLTSLATSVATSDEPLTSGDPIPPDLPPLACGEPAKPCESFSPGACQGSGFCQPYGTPGAPEGVGCVPQEDDVDPLMLGDPCVRGCDGQALGVSGCPEGSTCDPFSASPTCLDLCGGAEDTACPLDLVCVEHWPSGGGAFGLCRTCDPTQSADNGCNLGQTCVPSKGGELMCQPSGEAQVGESCSLLDDCAPGLACAIVGKASGPTCSPFCVPGDGTCDTDCGLAGIGIDLGIGICGVL